ncbi:TetR/AcrR family transcriptional regulator [Solicola sp. PLA-1-18]|uniref:TetR/AcrR family transcriptional regulator n=1 Tax=Solicola sp. PLA-1-18 TaxID=3380532 RepID=UPI003B81433C
MTATTRERTPQGERTARTRARLMDATIECLVELGWAGTSTTVVSQRAGVSRGAQLHHFPAKQDLVLASVEHLAERLRDDLDAAAADLPDGGRRTRAVLDVFAAHLCGPVFTAALELWVAARTDAALHDAVAAFEQRLGRETHAHAVRLLGVDESVGENRQLVQSTLDLLRGLALAQTLADDSRRRSALLDTWSGVLDDRLEVAP